MNPVDADLLKAFHQGEIPLENWNQRTHVALAWIHLEQHGFAGALDRLRSGIQTYNQYHAIRESPTSGYNETTTVALLTLVESVRRAYGQAFPVSDSSEFCDRHPQLMSKHILRLFYSPARRMHPEAKHRFIPPDLAALPRVSCDRGTDR